MSKVKILLLLIMSSMIVALAVYLVSVYSTEKAEPANVQPKDALGGVFQNLALENTPKLYLQDEWATMSPIPPRQRHFRLERKGDIFGGEAIFRLGNYNSWPSETIKKLNVPNSVMQEFFRQIKLLRVVEMRYSPATPHTDDFPDLRFSFETNLGQLEIYSQSQGEEHIPWGVSLAGRSFVINSGEPYKIFKFLEPYLQPEGEKEAESTFTPYKEEKALPEPSPLNKPSLLQEVYRKSIQNTQITEKVEAIYSLAISADGKTVATGTFRNGIKLWDSEKGQVINSLQSERDGREPIAITFSPNGKYLASVNRSDYKSDSTIYLWNLADQKQIAKFRESLGNVMSLAFTPDSKFLVTTGNERTIRLWEIPSGKLKASFKGQVPEFYEWYAVAVSPDGKTLAAAGSGNYQTREFPVKLWNLENGQELLTFKAHANSVRTLAFSPDSETLASAGHDQTIKLWNYRTGQLKQTLTVNTATVTGKKATSAKPLSFDKKAAGGTSALVFSPDGKRLASAHPAGYLRLWDAATGAELSVTPTQADIGNFYLAFAPDGKTLYSGHYTDGSLKKWQIIG